MDASATDEQPTSGDRQTAMRETYTTLTKASKERTNALKEAAALYRFARECDDFETWAKQKKALLIEPPSAQHIDANRRQFDVGISI